MYILKTICKFFVVLYRSQLLLLLFCFANPSYGQPNAPDAQSTANTLIAAGQEYFGAGQYEPAYRHFSSFLPIYPQDIRFYRWIAISAVYAGQASKSTAEAEFRKALAPGYSGPLDPSLSRYGLARIFFEAKEPDAAREALEPLLSEASAPPAFALLLAGNLRMNEGKYQEAADYAQRAHAADPDLLEARRFLDLMEMAKALVDLEKKMRSDSDRDAAMEMLAKAMMAMLYDPASIDRSMIRMMETLLKTMESEPSNSFKTLLAITIKLAYWSLGDDTIDELNDRVRELRAQLGQKNQDLDFYATILERVFEVNYASQRLDLAYGQLQELANLAAQVGQPRKQLRMLYRLEGLAGILGNPLAAGQHRLQAEQLVEQLRKRSRQDFLLAFDPILMAVAAVAAILLFLAGGAWRLRQADQWNQARPCLSAEYCRRITRIARQMAVQHGLRIARLAALGAAPLVILGLAGMWALRRWYEAGYRYPAIHKLLSQFW